MGELLGRRFIATHRQIGRFEVLDDHGALKKNGGNVASYFCTHDGRVINAVLGPVTATELLDEARFAIENAPPDSQGFDLAELRAKLADAQRRRGESVQPNEGRGRAVHRFLADHPLAKVDDIDRRVFAELLNEQVDTDQALISSVEDAFREANRLALPIVWILDKRGSNQDSIKKWREMTGVLEAENRPGARIAATYAVIALPTDEAAALSQRLKIRPFVAPDQKRPLFVVTRSTGKQLVAVTTWEKRTELIAAMAQGLIQEAKERPRDRERARTLFDTVKLIDKDLARQASRIPWTRSK